MGYNLVDILRYHCWVGERTAAFAFTDCCWEYNLGFVRRGQFVLDLSLVACLHRTELCFLSAEGCFHSQYADLFDTCFDSQIQGTCFLDFDDISVVELLSQLLLTFELLINKLFVVIGVCNVRWTWVTFVDDKGEKTWPWDRNNEVNILFRLKFERKLMLQRQVNDLSTVHSNWKHHFFCIFVVNFNPVVALACEMQKHGGVDCFLLECRTFRSQLHSIILITLIVKPVDLGMQFVQSFGLRSWYVQINRLSIRSRIVQKFRFLFGNKSVLTDKSILQIGSLLTIGVCDNVAGGMLAFLKLNIKMEIDKIAESKGTDIGWIETCLIFLGRKISRWNHYMDIVVSSSILPWHADFVIVE